MFQTVIKKHLPAVQMFHALVHCDLPGVAEVNMLSALPVYDYMTSAAFFVRASRISTFEKHCSILMGLSFPSRASKVTRDLSGNVSPSCRSIMIR